MEIQTEKDKEQAEPAAATAQNAGAPAQERRGPPQRERPRGDDDRPRRRGGRGRRRVCIMCADKLTSVDYKDTNFLRQYISDRGRIDSRRKSGACAKHQRVISRAIKRARHLALLPYTEEHVRGMGVTRSR